MQIDSIYAVDISSNMISKARDKGCYTELYVAELESFLSGIPSAETHRAINEVNTVVAADVFVYFGDFSSTVRAGVEALVSSTVRGPKAMVFSVEALPAALGRHAEEHTLQQSGRHAHSKGYLISMIETLRSSLTTEKSRTVTLHHKITEVILRKNNGVDVLGFLVRIELE